MNNVTEAPLQHINILKNIKGLSMDLNMYKKIIPLELYSFKHLFGLLQFNVRIEDIKSNSSIGYRHEIQIIFFNIEYRLNFISDKIYNEKSLTVFDRWKH